MSDVTKKEIVLSVLKEQVEKGMKKKELAAFYGISVVQMTKALQQAGLEIRRFRYPSFVLVDDTKTTAVAEEKVEENLESAEENTTLEAAVSASEPAAPEASTPGDLGGLLGMGD